MRKVGKIISKKYIPHVTFALLNLFKSTVSLLPRRLTQSILSGLFSFANIWMKRLKKICVRNFKKVYGDCMDEASYYALATRYIRAIGLSMIDMLYFVNRPVLLNKVLHIHNEQNLKDALKAGRGVIGVTAHLGNFPLMFQALVQRGYKVNVVIRKMRDENFSEFMKHECAKWGINMIETTPPKEFLRQSLESLARNEILFILLDEVVEASHGVHVKFLNTNVVRARGPAMFFKRTQAFLLPMFIVQDEKRDFHIHIEPAFNITFNLSAKENDVWLIHGLSRIIEKYVRIYPLQWGGWFNKKWDEFESSSQVG